MLVKKLTAVSMALAMSLPLIPLPVSAEDSVKVFVTIADGDGKLALTQKAVTVTDVDNDGTLTISDALYQAHEDNYKGGAKAGYEALLNPEYGLSLEMLWGVTNGGSYGYYVNHAMAWSLGDAVKDGDFIDAFCYTTEDYSDVYCYFDTRQADAVKGDSVTLTLNCIGFDETWLPVSLPVENAVITVNGKDTKYKTDADGKVTLKLNTVGTATISAKSDSAKLIPPVSIVNVSETAPTLFGDADENGEVDILDIITINKNILGKEILSAQAQKNADVDNNQKIDSNDALNLLKYLVGIITELPVA
ncbi:MAG: dockerin type I repeat-containing protein [Oscillospiraceae bacterium]|nr:dockerin type I repeat-containing protein [Oscillospiraceae bacterium]